MMSLVTSKVINIKDIYNQRLDDFQMRSSVDLQESELDSFELNSDHAYEQESVLAQEKLQQFTKLMAKIKEQKSLATDNLITKQAQQSLILDNTKKQTIFSGSLLSLETEMRQNNIEFSKSFTNGLGANANAFSQDFQSTKQQINILKNLSSTNQSLLKTINTKILSEEEKIHDYQELIDFNNRQVSETVINYSELQNQIEELFSQIALSETKISFNEEMVLIKEDKLLNLQENNFLDIADSKKALLNDIENLMNENDALAYTVSGLKQQIKGLNDQIDSYKDDVDFLLLQNSNLEEEQLYYRSILQQLITVSNSLELEIDSIEAEKNHMFASFDFASKNLEENDLLEIDFEQQLKLDFANSQPNDLSTQYELYKRKLVDLVANKFALNAQFRAFASENISDINHETKSLKQGSASDEFTLLTQQAEAESLIDLILNGDELVNYQLITEFLPETLLEEVIERQAINSLDEASQEFPLNLKQKDTNVINQQKMANLDRLLKEQAQLELIVDLIMEYNEIMQSVAAGLIISAPNPIYSSTSSLNNSSAFSNALNFDKLNKSSASNSFNFKAS